ncbi:glycosyltransferase 87 family protein [Nocardia sp. NPDC046763]|uniref:glycosyltransferase 87 family protein n=1 Tax=Nocardia sp. NPDC046763 TaxID=3155256 RepID=UPI0033F74A41
MSGALVGLAAGVKLTPAVTGLYFTARRQWPAAIGSAVAFAWTIGVTYLLTPKETRRYFGELPGDPHRPLPVGSVINQSLRGALSRLAGHDIGSGLLWKAAVLVTAVLAFFAWRALRPVAALRSAARGRRCSPSRRILADHDTGRGAVPAGNPPEDNVGRLASGHPVLAGHGIRERRAGALCLDHVGRAAQL